MERKKTIVASLENLREAVDFVEESAHYLNVHKEELWKIRLASEEVISNIISHGQNPKNHIEIKCHTYIDEKFYLLISDYGIFFDLTQYKSYSSLHTIEELIEKVGIRLVYGVMDEVHYVREDKKNTWILIKELHAYS